MTDRGPRYIIAATPEPPVVQSGRAVIREFFAVDGDPARLLERPPETRYASFGLATLAEAKLVEGKYLEVRSGPSILGDDERKRLRLYADGTTVFSADGGSAYLGWPKEPPEFGKAPRVNPIVVVDSAVSFARFCKALMGLFVVAPDRLRIRVALRGAIPGGKPMYVIPGPVNDRWRFDEGFNRRTVLGPDVHEQFEVPVATLLAEAPGDPTVGTDVVALRIAAAFYQLFGMSMMDVPYAEDSTHGRRIRVRLYDKEAY